MSRELRTALIVAATAVAAVTAYYWFMAPYNRCISEREALGSNEQAASAYCLKAVTAE